MSIKRILHTLSTNINLEVNQELSFLIALSAGQDSTCLTFFLVICQKLKLQGKNIRLGIIHCQHNWNYSSLDTANHIDSWVALLEQVGVKITFYSCIPNAPIPTEAESRQWRLKVFNRIAKKYQYNILFTGHTLNDEVETFLMQQLIRGFSSSLVKGSSFSQVHLKPFSWIYRNEILRICKYWQFPVFADCTNNSILLPRSRMRLELFSILKAFYNPQIENSLKQTIQIQKEKNSAFKENGISIHLICNKNRIVLNRLKINQLPLLIQRSLWRQCFETLGLYNIGFYWIEKCLFYSQTKKNFSFYFTNNIKLKGSPKWLILSKNQN
uniref:tRNA(Ile)-lysidine synthase, chloroplastic n=1 Tax=Chloropicon laureae TaxID=464258 RepID=A0A4D6C1L7_9CHLO|nr:tRNA(Ile)-lysidine synthetase [Chloropicon laureae]QBX97746.1 tRNA(Ile)-lysidine synthetase [Chloropicon laureae]